MSGFDLALGIVEIAAIELVTIKPYRAMGGFTADAVVEEQHNDELMLTDQPVEQGAVITDHAYKLPAELVLTYGWSESSNQAAGDPTFLQDLYQQLLTLQVNRTLFEVFTGKRYYQNMILKGLATTTERKTEHALIVRATCREMLLATTQTVTVPDASVMTNPAKNAPVALFGVKYTLPAPNLNVTALP